MYKENKFAIIYIFKLDIPVKFIVLYVNRLSVQVILSRLPTEMIIAELFI